MSYLPRMSKTYKEPEERTYEDATKEITFNSIPIASALPDDKAYNPQTVLKQYSFYPHPPPQLPGPSLITEAEQDEKINVEAKRRRTREGSQQELEVHKGKEVEEFPFENTGNANTSINFAFIEYTPFKEDSEGGRPSSSRKTSRSNKIFPKKISMKTGKKKSEGSKQSKTYLNSGTEIAESGISMSKEAEDEVICVQSCERMSTPITKESQSTEGNSASTENVHSEKGATLYLMDSKNTSTCSIKKIESTLIDAEDCALSHHAIRGSVHEGVQCSPSGNNEKIFIMPPSMHYLLRTLSFLIRELDKNEDEDSLSKEVKKLVGQINEAISALSERNIDPKFVLQTSLSDSKRLEKIYYDLEHYVKHIYGENGKIGCKLEEKKKISCELFQKEYELKVLNIKLRESEIQNPSLNMMEQVNKAPEIVLQNKNLENEQFLAEIEFNSQELKKFQQALAEKDWEIQNSREEIEELKKKLATLKPKLKAPILNKQTYSPIVASKEIYSRKSGNGP